ncbi:protein kinase domain containing protein expressed, partial [Trifolium medium]|nr:protein kinase domain containing protein expressed [Trifolium medium]
DRRRRKSNATNADVEPQKETSDTEKSDYPDSKSNGRNVRKNQRK